MRGEEALESATSAGMAGETRFEGRLTCCSSSEDDEDDEDDVALKLLFVQGVHQQAREQHKNGSVAGGECVLSDND